MAKYKVTGVARNRITGLQVGKIRNEIINTKTNKLFPKDNLMDIKNRYESFWNDLNTRSTEIVTVLKIKKIR